MKLRWKIFIANFTQSLLICILVGGLVFFITKKGYYALFFSSYERTFKLLEKAISTIELDADKIALNAAYVFRNFEDKNGFPNENQSQELKNQLSVSNFYAADHKGKFIFATNGVSIEKHEELNLNLYNGCSEYRKILTHGTVEQTPIIYAKFEPIDRASKYTMISSLDKRRILEVGISVTPIIDRLRDLIIIDENIKSISLFTPTGDTLFSQPSTPTYLEDILRLSKELVEKPSIKEWHGSDLLMLTKVQPKTNQGKCCECIEKGLTIDGKYFYVLAAVISAMEFEGIIGSHFTYLFGFLAGVAFFSVLISSTLSKALTKPLMAFTEHFRKFGRKDVSQFVPIPISGSDEIAEMGKQYNYLIDGAKEAQRLKIESEIQKTRLEAQAKLESERAESAAAQAKLHAESEAAKEALARQVKHDLATPIRAAQLQIDHLKADDTEKSELRHNINQISDIVNSLVGVSPCRTVRSHMLVSLIEMAVSVVRWEHKDTPGVEITFSYSPDAYSLFAEVKADEFRRALSNVIKNSVQAIHSEQGHVQITLKASGAFAEIRVIDNGKGIPNEILPKIFDRDFSYDKKDGSGLGLSHAKEVITQWRGEILATSQLNVGTEITIKVPKSKPPVWFVSHIIVPVTCTFIIVDDDPYYHEFWSQKAAQLVKEHCCKIDLIHYHNSEEFIASFESGDSIENPVYVIDYDLSSPNKITGFDLITKYDLKRNAYLITHRWDEETIQNFCMESNIGLIPKTHISIAPVKVISPQKNKYDCAIIDDDLYMLKSLAKKAKREGKNVLFFSSLNDFLREAAFISRDTDICIDSGLGVDIPGHITAKGFSSDFDHIYSISMETSIDWSEFPWISGHRSKDSPWA